MGFGSISFEDRAQDTGARGQGNDYYNALLEETGNSELIDTTSPVYTSFRQGHHGGGGRLLPTQNFGNVGLNTQHLLADTGDPRLFPVMKAGNAYDTAWNVHNYQGSLRDSMYTPLLEDTAAQTGRSSMVGSAIWDTIIQDDVSKGISERNRSRYGQNIGPAQLEYMDDARDRGMKLALSNNVNNARIDEYEYDNSLRRGMINIGRQNMNSAAAGAGIAAGTQSQRETAGESARAAHQAQQQQSAAAAASAIITIAMLAPK